MSSDTFPIASARPSERGGRRAWLSRSLLGPLRDLTTGVQRFTAGDYAAQVKVRTTDEIGWLCSAFNGMVGELRDKSVVIDSKNRENEQLLLNVLPAPMAGRLRAGETNIADGFDDITVAFATLSISRSFRRAYRRPGWSSCSTVC